MAPTPAYNFDGGGQQYINMGPVLFPENAFTVSIWANFKPGNNKYAHLIENGTLEKNFSGAFRLEHTPTEGEIYFALGDGSTMVENKNNGQHKNTGWKWNTWNHYILSYNGNVALLYQNGALVDQLSTTLDIREGDGTGVGGFMAGEFIHAPT